MNNYFFNKIVNGRFGRKIAYTSVPEITEANVVKVVGDCIGIHNFNRAAIRYLWTYKNGDQPALYRTKTIRDDIVNKVVENHAWEIVRFKMGQTYGEPIMYNSLSDDAKINEAVDRFNGYIRNSGKAAKDLSMGEWQSAVGVGYEAVQLRGQDEDTPFRIIVPNPINTFVIYSEQTQEPMLAVQDLKDENGNSYYLCFSKTHEYRIQNSQLLPLDLNDAGVTVYSRLHIFGEIPIVEYPNNQDRISDVELVISMLDAISNMASNRQDSIEQFVQSWIKFVNCDIDESSFAQMKKSGALVVKSNNGSENKADVDIMTQELNQTQAQVAKDDLLDNILSILAIPSKQENGTGDRAGAVSLRNGWDHAKQAARIKDAYVVESEYRLSKCIRNAINVRKGVDELPLTNADYEPVINHSPTDNMQVKAESFKMLIESGVHPLVALKTSGLWNDAEKVYLLSKPYFDALYKTADELEKEKEEVVNNGLVETGRTEQPGEAV